MKYNPPRFLFRRFIVMKQVKSRNHFLEIGPGNLNLSLDLLTKFNHGTLIDFNTTEVQKKFDGLPEAKKEMLKLIIADFTEYDQFDNEFDCVVSCEVLEHIDNDGDFLKKTNDLLMKGGQLILSVPARQKYWSRHDEIAGHCRRYEKQELYAKLSEAGFSEIKIVSYGFPFINIFRLGRVSLANIQYREKSRWDPKKKTQESGFINKRNSYQWVGYLINKYTFFPFCLIASLFENLDLSEGYVASAIKG
jgi:SAM-dependent methyltransferase